MPATIPSQCDVIHDALLAANGEWVPMPRLVRLSGSYNIHSRIDELRHERGIAIENRIERHPRTPRRHLSFYRITA